MNAAPDLNLWVELLIVTGLGTALIVGSAAFVSRVVRAASRRRVVWQASTVCLAALVLGELSGSAPLLARLLRVATQRSPEVPNTNGTIDTFATADIPAGGDATSNLTEASLHGTVESPAAPVADPSADGRTRSSSVPIAELSVLAGTDATGVPPPLAPGSVGWARGASGADGPEPTTTAVARDRPGGSVGDAEVVTGIWWPGVLWIAGVSVLLSRALFAWTLLFFVCRRRAEESTSPLTERVRTLARRLGLGRPVRVIRIGRVSGPLAAGILQPTIGVPEDFDREYDPAQQEAMLLHELGHLAGHDPAWHVFADLVTIALWWHPVAWWARHELRVAGEFAADETSAVVESGPDALAASLVKVGARLAGTRPISSRLSGLTYVEGNGFRSGLGQRVERLLSLSHDPGRLRDRHPDRFSRTATLAVMVAALVSSSLWLRPLTVEADLASYRENTRQGESTMTTTLLPLWKRSLAGLTFLAVLGAGAAQHEDAVPEQDQNRARDQEAQSRDRIRTLEDQVKQLSDQLAQLSKRLETERKAAKELKRSKAPARGNQAAQQLVPDLRGASAQQPQPAPRQQQQPQPQQPQPSAFPFGLPSRASDTGSQSDLIGLATKLADAMGDARLARLRYGRISQMVEQNLVAQDEVDVARINLETAEQKIQLLREIARAYLSRAESQIVFLHGERRRLSKYAKPDESRLRSIESQMQAAEAVYGVLKSLATLKEPGGAEESKAKKRGAKRK